MNTVMYLDAAKKKLGIESDYALAPRVGLTRQAISKLRNGHLVMSNTTAAHIAGILGVPAIKVIADAELERGTNDELWTQIGRVAVFGLVAIGALIGGAAGFDISQITGQLAYFPLAAVTFGSEIHIVSMFTIAMVASVAVLAAVLARDWAGSGPPLRRA